MGRGYTSDMGRAMRGAFCLSLVILAIQVSTETHAQSKMPCMVSGRACQLPGTQGLGNNMVSMPLGTFNSQFTGTSRPSLGAGLGVSPKDGSLLYSGGDVKLVEGTGFTTTFNKSGNRFISEFAENGDLREIEISNGTLKVISPDGFSTTYGQPFQGRYFPTLITDPDGHRLFSATWKNGLPLTQVDQVGGTTTFTSDSFGRVRSIKTPEGLVYSFTYNRLGRLQKAQVGDVTTEYSYDAAGNLTEIKPSTGPSTLFAYGKDNVLVGTGDGNTTTTISYSTTSTTAESTSGSFTQFSTTTFGKFGRMYLPVKQEGADGFAKSGGSVLATIERDGFGNVIKSTDASGRSTSYQLVKGLPTKVTSPDNVVVTFTRNPNDKYRVTSQSTFGANGAPLSTTDYAWDSGKLKSVTSKDSQGRVVGVQTIARSGSSTTTTAKFTEYYTWDPTGPKGRLIGIESISGKQSITFNGLGVPTQFDTNGVTTTVTRDVSPDGRVKVTTNRGGLVALAESNFLGTEVSSSLGDSQGRFIAQNNLRSSGTALKSNAAESWSVMSGKGLRRGKTTSAFTVSSPGTNKTTRSSQRSGW